MRISHGTRLKNINDANGYGYATVKMLESLTRVGYEVKPNDPTADVEIWFDQPQHWKFSEGPYKIGYHPWESTQLKEGWPEIMNQCDEIWTPSPLVAQWYTKYAGITVPVYVYEHGVSKVWTPKKRTVDGPIKFLHMGLDAARKGGSETMRAHREAFGGTGLTSLTMKTNDPGWGIPRVGGADILSKPLSETELVQLFHDHHVFVLPTYGEGFGLPGLQAIATGMPTITVPATLPYRKYLEPDLNISSRLLPSIWRQDGLHPGKMYKPKYEDVVTNMKRAVENYDLYHQRALARTDAIKTEYDWDLQTKKAFGDLQQRLNK